MKIIETSASEKLLPIYNVETEENKVALTMNCAWSADDIDSILKAIKKSKIETKGKGTSNIKLTQYLINFKILKKI